MVPLPAWEAVMVQVPEATNVVVVPETVQTLVVDEAKVTGNPDVAEADSVNGAPTVWVGIALNVMVCGFGITVKLCVTGVAAA